MFEVGATVGGCYRIVRAIGRGGMGEVYEAIHEPLARRVAIKTLLPELAENPSLLLRFRREAEASAALGHPNIVQVTEFRADEGMPPFIVMELLEGRTFRDLIVKSGKVEPARAVFIALQVLSGLEAAHESGIIHRDVKPANIYLQKTLAVRDLVKLVDFGIAKLVEAASSSSGGEGERAPFTQHGQIIGTQAYMAPEQATGEAVDHRADLFAVGATLFHALSGVRPREVDVTNPMNLWGGRVTLAAVAPSIDPALATIVDKALEPMAVDRYASAKEMAEALSRFGRADAGLGTSVMGNVPEDLLVRHAPRNAEFEQTLKDAVRPSFPPESLEPATVAQGIANRDTERERTAARPVPLAADRDDRDAGDDRDASTAAAPADPGRVSAFRGTVRMATPPLPPPSSPAVTSSAAPPGPPVSLSATPRRRAPIGAIAVAVVVVALVLAAAAFARLGPRAN